MSSLLTNLRMDLLEMTAAVQVSNDFKEINQLRQTMRNMAGRALLICVTQYKNAVNPEMPQVDFNEVMNDLKRLEKKTATKFLVPGDFRGYVAEMYQLCKNVFDATKRV